MSYLLIGNLSALVCDDAIEHVSKATIRVYLPASRFHGDDKQDDNTTDLHPITPTAYLQKKERLLAEGTVDETGHFSLAWEEIHLFTEPLEFDISLSQVPGKRAAQTAMHFQLGMFVPQWKREHGLYKAAFAYIIPSHQWSVIRGAFRSWVITGTVKHAQTISGIGNLRVEAYNAENDQLISWGTTNEKGKFKLYYNVSEEDSSLQAVVHADDEEYYTAGPSIYFKIYRHNQLIWSEGKDVALLPERQQITPCSRMHLYIDPAASSSNKPGGYEKGWLHNLMDKSQSIKYTF
ncbi:hypothetical protein LX64_01890 [Chitinophaga skermanii]|uniref:Carboxypeptidase family protein n=1 Tax=Chitinophaga skermanii TaxID=331697 RepID=A0A327QTN3_9BACT|nr:hypothetical protein [Chitinophaga skermanii]RAJ06763.1 hypothetical protein LX64_01890 [Chitinophaga skermanii]